MIQKILRLSVSLIVLLQLTARSQLVETRDADLVDSLLNLATDPKEIADLSIELYKAYKYNKLKELPNEGAYLIQALQIYDSLELLEEAAYTHNSLAGMYYNRGQVQDAKENWEKALELYQHLGNTKRIGVMYNNLAHAYIKDSTEYGQSMRRKYLEDAIEIHMQTGNDRSLGLTYSNVGDIYVDNQEYEEAERYYMLALELAISTETPYYAQSAYRHLGEVALLQLDYRKTIDLTKKSLAYGEVRPTDPIVSQAHLQLAKAYRALGDYKSADQSQLMYTSIQKELYEVQKIRQLLDLETKYNTEKKEQEIELLKEREAIQAQALQAEQQVKNYLAIIVIISIIGLIAIGILYQKSKRRSAEIALQKVELEKLNATKDRFFGIIAHDLRNPVISFQGIARLIDSYLKKGKMDKIEQLSDKIQHSVNNLNQLLDNLLNWASSQTSALPYHPEPLPITQVIDEAISLFSDTAEAKQIGIANNVNNDIVIYADRNGVSTIFRNLINNALKFTPEGGEIDIAAELDGDMVKIVTTDNGVGIDQSKISSLFQLSNEKSTEGTSGEKGTGLGLVLCQEFAKVNKGLIWVESELRKGSSFYVSMPTFNKPTSTNHTSQA
ncbi:MAG: ATP-binding protein [Cyclobacteriaceae bacterium]